MSNALVFNCIVGYVMCVVFIVLFCSSPSAKAAISIVRNYQQVGSFSGAFLSVYVSNVLDSQYLSPSIFNSLCFI